MRQSSGAMRQSSTPVNRQEPAASHPEHRPACDRSATYVLSFGYPADPAVLTKPNRPGGRKPLGELVHHERWGGDPRA